MHKYSEIEKNKHILAANTSQNQVNSMQGKSLLPPSSNGGIKIPCLGGSAMPPTHWNGTKTPCLGGSAMPMQRKTKSPVQKKANEKDETVTTENDFKIKAQITAPDDIAEGKSVQIPDIVAGLIDIYEEYDAINSTLAYSGNVSHGGATPNGFGVTRSGWGIRNINVISNAGTFDVTATLRYTITYQVRTATGPSGQVDILSDADGAITQTNYAQVSSDLTPDMGDLNGRPPRSNFWASDLTLRHERFHADERNTLGGQEVPTVQTWLNSQTANDVPEVRSLLRTAAQRARAGVNANMAYPGKEERAYGDGAASYTARANSIKAKGDNNEYPA